MSEPSDSLQERMRKLGIREADLQETFSHSSGPGGQNVNKVATAVRLRHLPSGIGVTVQDSRSQARNRQLARERLLAAIEERERNQRKERIALRERERRRTRPRPRALKKKILESKKKRATLKKLRGRVID
jgi:protein subunit release factor B